jgi:structural maintenance of chromosome 3 (chondroitin sulfate proteoglycan 6)
LRREENQLESVQRTAREQLRDAEQGLAQVMDRNTSRGLAAVREIAARQNIPGVYGTVAELVEVPKQYEMAAENSAGASLFHYVVDSQRTSSKLIETLNKERLGRVTFIPLDGIEPKAANIPRASDVTHLLKKLRYDSKYEKAFQQIFGKTIVCPTLQIASQYARSHGLDAMTPEGYRADKKGSLTGGYYGDRRSRLEAIKKERTARQNLESHNQRLNEIADEIRQMDQQITRAYSELEKARRRKEQAGDSYVPLRQELSRSSQELQRKEDELERVVENQQGHEADLRNLEREQSERHAEMAKPFQPSLSGEEEQRLEQLGASVRELRRQYAELNESKSTFESQKSNIEAELRQNLRPREQELLSQETDSAGGAANSSIDLKEAEHDLKRKAQAYDAARKRLGKVETEIDQQTDQFNSHFKKREDLQKVLEQLAKEIEQDKKRLENSSAEKQRLKVELEHAVRAINDIGVVPQDAFDKYRKWDNEKVRTTALIFRISESDPFPDKFTVAEGQGIPQKVFQCEQESLRAVCKFYQAERQPQGTQGRT